MTTTERIGVWNQLVGQELLRALGLQATLAENGNSALAACVAQPPALVLMDLQLPGMDGLETTRRLRALQREQRWPGAPIVALTAHASPEDHAACRAAGAPAGYCSAQVTMVKKPHNSSSTRTMP